MDKKYKHKNQHLISIAAFPEKGVAYNECFYKALKRKGVHVAEGNFTGRWVIKNAKKFDYFHFHWPSFLYAYNGNMPKTIYYFIKYIFLLVVTRLFSTEILWTAHNLYPHEKLSLFAIDKLARHVITFCATTIFVHGITSKKMIEKEFPITKGKTIIIDHGHFIDHHKNESDYEQARRKMDIPKDMFVYLFLGSWRAYKNIEFLIETYKKIHKNIMLIIAGPCPDENYLKKITDLTEVYNNIRLNGSFIPEDELQFYLNACDVFVLPYTNILTSGGCMLALSFGRPVIGPMQGNLLDVINDECGILYDPKDPRGLHNAMVESQKREYNKKKIIEYARTYDWGRIAEKVISHLRIK